MTPISVLLFARAHWRACLVAASLALAFGAGWRTHARLYPPPVCTPTVAAHEQEHATNTTTARTDTETARGPREVVTVVYRERQGAVAQPVAVPGLSCPVQAPPGEQVASVRIERDAPVVTDTHAVSEQHAEQDRHLDLTVTPPPAAAALPRLELQLGAEDVLHARTLRAAARYRLAGPLWGEVSVRPADRTVGVALAIGF